MTSTIDQIQMPTNIKCRTEVCCEITTSKGLAGRVRGTFAVSHTISLLLSHLLCLELLKDKSGGT